jgi:hypothetical protein
LDKPGTSADLFLLPLDDDDITNKDNVKEEETLPKDTNHLGRSIQSLRAELVTYSTVDELPDITQAGPSKRVPIQQDKEDEAKED